MTTSDGRTLDNNRVKRFNKLFVSKKLCMIKEALGKPKNLSCDVVFYHLEYIFVENVSL